jgi:prephenate dehydrogenase
MQVADSRADDHAALLRLAAGGFRDMTRIASGHPAIWPDICAENRTAILDGLDALIDGLRDMRDLVDRGDGAAMTSQLERARRARSNLPVRASRPEHLVEIRVPIPDRPGALAEIATLAAELGVNLDAFEVVHSAEGDKGTAILLIDAERRDLYRGGLIARGYRPGVQPLE